MVLSLTHRYGGERCQWFTMFRDPIARVVSAYFYCKHAPIDPLCATSIMRANKVDLLTFAQHWGNFGLRCAQRGAPRGSGRGGILLYKARGKRDGATWKVPHFEIKL